MRDEFKQAKRTAMLARERGQVRDVEPTRADPEYKPQSVLFEKPKGWRKLFIAVRRVPTKASQYAAILPTPEEIEGTR